MSDSNEYGHEFDNPLSQLNALEMALLASRPPDDLRCPHCEPTHRMLPMTGTAWGLDTSHGPDCPHHDDHEADQ